MSVRTQKQHTSVQTAYDCRYCLWKQHTSVKEYKQHPMTNLLTPLHRNPTNTYKTEYMIKSSVYD